VRRAAILVREDRPGDRRLVAYVVGQGGEPLDLAQLRAYLADRLPDHMVPGAFVALDDLPLDPNGKVDRRALPAPAEVAAPPRETVAPRTAMEELVAGVWSHVLGVETVGVHDDFFDLGGHSLLATRLVSRLADLAGVEVPLREVFERPTVAGVAAVVEELHRLHRGAAPPPPLPRSPRVDREARRLGGAGAPLSLAQERLWFLDRFDPGSTVYNIPTVFRFVGALSVPLLARALSEVVRRHESLRTVYREVDGTPLQRVEEPAPVELPVIDLSGLPTAAGRAEAARVESLSAATVFDLALGPVWSAWLLRLSPREHHFAWCVHHVAADGWSMGIVIRELTALYDAWSRGLASPLAEPPVQYADFAVWQRRALADGPLEEQVEYWRRRLDGAPRALELPLDRPRPPKQRFRGERIARTVPPELFGPLSAWAAAEGSTLFMLLLAGLGTVLSRWSGQADLLVGSPVAGRGRSEVDGLVGMFLNSLVLRLELDPDPSGPGKADEAPTFRQVLRRAREAALGAYTHQDVPFEMLLEALEVDRELSRTPLFQVFLNVASFPQDRVPLDQGRHRLRAA
jgi:acyl carrier protein